MEYDDTTSLCHAYPNLCEDENFWLYTFKSRFPTIDNKEIKNILCFNFYEKIQNIAGFSGIDYEMIIKYDIAAISLKERDIKYMFIFD